MLECYKSSNVTNPRMLQGLRLSLLPNKTSPAGGMRLGYVASQHNPTRIPRRPAYRLKLGSECPNGGAPPPIPPRGPHGPCRPNLTQDKVTTTTKED